MAKYPKLHSTNKGRELVAESNAKKKAIEYTKAVIGDAQYNDSIDSLLAVVSPKMECAFSSGEVSAPSQFTINFTIDNHNLENGFYAREIGIYARLEGTEDEILFAYTNGGNYVDYIPDKSTPVDAQMVEAIINIGDAENVTIVKNDGTFITWKDLNNHNSDPNAHGGILASINTKISEATKPVLAQLNSGLDKLESHNTDVLSHPAITAVIAKILGDTDWQATPADSLKNIKNNLGFGGIVAQRLEKNGYVQFANGFTIQWGRRTELTIYDNRMYDEVFPKNFETECLGVVVTLEGRGPVSGASVAYTDKRTTTGFTIVADASNAVATSDLFYLAVGY